MASALPGPPLRTSEGVEEIAKSLVRLALRVRDRILHPTTLTREVGRIRGIVKAVSPTMRNRAHEFAAVGSPDYIPTVGRVHFNSAHHAAFSEATRLLSALREELNPTAVIDTWQAIEANPDEAVRTQLLETLNTGTDFNVDDIATHWDKAIAAVEGVLTPEWLQDFASIPNQVYRERAGLLTKESPADSDQWLNHLEIAKKFGTEAEATRQKLNRWRGKNFDHYKEISDPKRHEPKYLYRLSAVEQIFAVKPSV